MFGNGVWWAGGSTLLSCCQGMTQSSDSADTCMLLQPMFAMPNVVHHAPFPHPAVPYVQGHVSVLLPCLACVCVSVFVFCRLQLFAMCNGAEE